MEKVHLGWVWEFVEHTNCIQHAAEGMMVFHPIVGEAALAGYMGASDACWLVFVTMLPITRLVT